MPKSTFRHAQSAIESRKAPLATDRAPPGSGQTTLSALQQGDAGPPIA